MSREPTFLALLTITQDNIDTHPDLGVSSTTAGAYALVGSRVFKSAPAVLRVGASFGGSTLSIDFFTSSPRQEQ